MSFGQWLFAGAYDLLNASVEWRIARYRRATAGAARGEVLEIGGGTGANFRFYPPGVSLTFLEPNPHMARRLRSRAEALRLRVKVVEECGERMPFADASFDTVVSTLVLCSVVDPKAVALEARRVLRPGGRFLFYEHVSAGSRRGRKLQAFLNPVWRRLAGGCHLDRDVEDALWRAGFGSVGVERFNIRFGTPLALPNVVGEAW